MLIKKITENIISDSVPNFAITRQENNSLVSIDTTPLLNLDEIMLTTDGVSGKNELSDPEDGATMTTITQAEEGSTVSVIKTLDVYTSNPTTHTLQTGTKPGLSQSTSMTMIAVGSSIYEGS